MTTINNKSGAKPTRRLRVVHFWCKVTTVEASLCLCEGVIFHMRVEDVARRIDCWEIVAILIYTFPGKMCLESLESTPSETLLTITEY